MTVITKKQLVYSPVEITGEHLITFVITIVLQNQFYTFPGFMIYKNRFNNDLKNVEKTFVQEH